VIFEKIFLAMRVGACCVKVNRKFAEPAKHQVPAGICQGGRTPVHDDRSVRLAHKDVVEVKVAMDQGMPFLVLHPAEEVAHLVRHHGASRAKTLVAAVASSEVKTTLDYASDLLRVGNPAGQRRANAAPLQLGGAGLEAAMNRSQLLDRCFQMLLRSAPAMRPRK